MFQLRKVCTRRLVCVEGGRSTSTRTTRTSSCTTAAAAGSLGSRLGCVADGSLLSHSPSAYTASMRWNTKVVILVFQNPHSGNLEHDQWPRTAGRPQPSCRPNMPRGICSKVCLKTSVQMIVWHDAQASWRGQSLQAFPWLHRSNSVWGSGDSNTSGGKK